MRLGKPQKLVSLLFRGWSAMCETRALPPPREVAVSSPSSHETAISSRLRAIHLNHEPRGTNY